MSDGKLIFETGLDNSKLKNGVSDAKSEISKMGDGFSKTGAKLTKYLTKPAVAAGAAFAGISLKKGFERLNAIDQAKAKLEGLKMEGPEIQKVMDSALESVKGTAFGLGEAATTSASAVAAGIKPGQELTRYLSLVADAASVAGTDMSEMGAVFNKVAANGKVSAEEMNMLTDRGIPLLSLLAKTTGKTVEEIRKDMEAGKISTEDFLSAIEQGMGGAAGIMGAKSLSAAIQNIGASIGRIGANFLDAGGKGGGFFSQLKPLMVDLSNWLSVIEEKSVKWGETFGKVFSSVYKGFTSIPGGVKVALASFAIGVGPMLKLTGATLKSVDALTKYRTTAKGASLMMGVLKGDITASNIILNKFGSGVKSAATSIVGLVRPAATSAASFASLAAAKVKDTAATVVNSAANSKAAGVAKRAASSVLTFAAAHKVAALAALGVVGAIAGFVIYMAKTGQSADEVAAKITDFANNAAAAITSFAQAFPGMVDGIVSALTQVITSISAQLPAIISALTNALTGAIPAVVSVIPTIVTALVGALPMLIAGLVQLVTALAAAIPKVIPPLVSALPTIIQAIVQGLITLIPVLIQAMITIVLALVQAIPQIISPLIEAIPTIMQALIDGLITAIPALIAAMPVIIKAVVKGLIAAAGAILTAGKTLITKLISGIKSAVPRLFSNVVNFAKQIPVKVKTVLGAMLAAGATLIAKLLSGLKSKFGSVLSAVGSFARSIPSRIKSALGSMTSIGADIVSGLWSGMSGRLGWIKSMISGWVGNVKSFLKSLFKIGSPSRWMRDEIGQWLPPGIGEGIEAATPDLLKTIRASMDKVKSAYTLAAPMKLSPQVYSSQFTNAEVAAASTYGLGDDLANAILPILRSIGGAKNAEIHIDNYLSPGTAQLGESIVKLNDIYGKRLGK